MTAMYSVGSDNLVPLILTTGVRASPAPTDTDGYTLVANTYYIPLASSEGPTISECLLAAFHVKWSAALAATITLESSNFPSTIKSAGTGRADVTDFESGATGNWIQENPASATMYNIGGASNTYTLFTFVAGGAAAGAVIGYLPNAGARRYRLKVICTVGGTLRAGACGKD